MRIDVDYTKHPAFAPHLRSDASAPISVEMFTAADAAIAGKISGRDAGGAALSEVAQSFRRFVDDDSQILAGLKPYVLAAHEAALARALDEAPHRQHWGRGFSDAPKSVKADVDKLRRWAASAPDDIVTTEPSNPESVRIVNEFAEQSGIFDMLSAYFGREFRKAGFVLHLSHPKDTWFHVFDDIGMPPPRSAQFHFDLKAKAPKAMCYLNDIDLANGPFSVVRRDDPWAHFGTEIAFRKELNYAIMKYVAEQYDLKVRGNTSFYRFVEARRAFGTLPRPLLGTAGPGDHAADGTALSQLLLDRETKITGEAGTMPVFAGSHILHRGGLVTSGERLALQIVFWPGNWRKEQAAAASAARVEQARAAASAGTKRPEQIMSSLRSLTPPGVRRIAGRLKRAAIFYGKRPQHLAHRLLLGRPMPDAVAGHVAAAAGPVEPAPVTSDPAAVRRCLAAIIGTGGPVVAVDVGGANDLQPHWGKLKGVAKFIVYEPHEDSFKELVDRQGEYAGYDQFTYINAALAGSEGPRTLYMTNVPTGSSIVPPKKGGFADHPRNTYHFPVHEVTIETTTLAVSLTKAGVERIDMIKLDTQCSELEILKGLDQARMDGLLVVEAEASVIDGHDGGERCLEDMLCYMREQGFTLFDLRTNRFIGNALRLDPADLTSVLGDKLDLPPNAHRMAEADAIFFREPLHLIKAGMQPAVLRRLIALLATYLFLPEAVFAARQGHAEQVISDLELTEILDALRTLHANYAGELARVAADIARADGQVWAQYMWVPSPSA